MNRQNLYIISIVFLSTFIFFHNTWASPTEIEPISKIRNVVIYSNSAMIKKEAHFPVKKGENIIRISGITPYLVDQSVQVSFDGKSAVKISEIKITETHLQKIKHDMIQKLQSRLDNLDDQIKTASNEISVISSSIEFLKKVIPFPQNQKVTPVEVEAHTKFLEKSLSENYSRIAGIEAKIKKLQKEKTSIEKEIKEISSPDMSKNIDFFLISPDDYKEINLVFSYVVNNAGWEPLYEVRTDSETVKTSISYFANIKQSTGEDWTDVNVELSTAKPYYASAPSELAAWYLDIYQPEHPDRFTITRAEKISKSAISLLEERAAVQEKSFEETQIKSETTSFSFIIPRKVNIPSDNQPHRVLIASQEKNTEFSYYAIPKYSKYAYLKAIFKNPFTFPLLSGRMNIFLDGRLVSASFLGKTILPDEDIKMFLGVDESISIERKLKKKFTEYAGFRSKEIKVNYEYIHEITNGKAKEISINISDHFPVSKNEKIKVNLETPKKDEAKISDDGIITWNVKMAPGEKKNLSMIFMVEYPKGLDVTGLE